MSSGGEREIRRSIRETAEADLIYPEDSASQVGGDGSVLTGEIDDDEFADAIKEWFTLDNELAALNKAKRVREKKKRALGTKVIEALMSAGAEDVKCRDGVLELKRETKKVRLTKDNIRKMLIEKSGETPEKVEKLVTMLTDERDTVEKVSLRRVKPKKVGAKKAESK